MTKPAPTYVTVASWGHLSLTALGWRAAEKWMRRELQEAPEEYNDCGECNCTLLAENAASALDLYLDPEAAAWDDEAAKIPEAVFEVAHQVAKRCWANR